MTMWVTHARASQAARLSAGRFPGGGASRDQPGASTPTAYGGFVIVGLGLGKPGRAAGDGMHERRPKLDAIGDQPDQPQSHRVVNAAWAWDTRTSSDSADAVEQLRTTLEVRPH